MILLKIVVKDYRKSPPEINIEETLVQLAENVEEVNVRIFTKKLLTKIMSIGNEIDAKAHLTETEDQEIVIDPDHRIKGGNGLEVVLTIAMSNFEKT